MLPMIAVDALRQRQAVAEDEVLADCEFEQLRARKVRVKLFLRHPLHAKLYLLFRQDPASPIIGFVGSSNLTMSGLAKQGELNLDVVEQDAAGKLSAWFDARWDDRWCINISDELIAAIAVLLHKHNLPGVVPAEWGRQTSAVAIRALSWPSTVQHGLEHLRSPHRRFCAEEF